MGRHDDLISGFVTFLVLYALASMLFGVCLCIIVQRASDRLLADPPPADVEYAQDEAWIDRLEREINSRR